MLGFINHSVRPFPYLFHLLKGIHVLSIVDFLASDVRLAKLPSLCELTAAPRVQANVNGQRGQTCNYLLFWAALNVPDKPKPWNNWCSRVNFTRSEQRSFLLIIKVIQMDIVVAEAPLWGNQHSVVSRAWPGGVCFSF